MRNKGKMAPALRWMLKHYAFLGAAALLISFVIFPLKEMWTVQSWRRLLLEMTSESTEPLSAGAILYYMKEITINAVYGPLNLEMITALFGALGFGSALVLFSHLFSRKQAMMLAAMPVRRELDLLHRSLTWGTLVLLPTALCILSCPLIAAAGGVSEYFSLGLFLRRGLSVLLILLYGYTLGMLCASVCGTWWSAILTGGVLLISLEGVRYCWGNLAAAYLNTLPVSRFADLTWSPVYSLYKAFYDPAGRFPLPGLAAGVLFAALAVPAYRACRPEKAGLTLNLKAAEIPGLVWITLAGGTLVGYAFARSFDTEASLYAGFLIGCAAAWLATRMLLDQNVRVSWKTWAVPAACAAVLAVGGLGLRADLFSVNSRLPDLSGITAVEYGESWSNVMTRLEDPDNLDAAHSWVELMRDHAEKLRRVNPFSIYTGHEVKVVWHLGGKTVTRYYPAPEDQAAAMPYLARIVGSAEYRAVPDTSAMTQVEVDTRLKTFGLYGGDFSDVFGFSEERWFYNVNAEEVRAALALDLADRTLEDMQQPCVLNVHFWGEDPETGYYLNGPTYSLTVRDTHTLRLLLGADMEQWVDFARGGYLDNEDLLVFRCTTGAEGELADYAMAESPEEAKAWLAQTTDCTDGLYQAPLSGEILRIYSKTFLKRRENLEIDDYSILPEMEYLSFASLPFRAE